MAYYSYSYSQDQPNRASTSAKNRLTARVLHRKLTKRLIAKLAKHCFSAASEGWHAMVSELTGSATRATLYALVSMMGASGAPISSTYMWHEWSVAVNQRGVSDARTRTSVMALSGPGG